ncbi:CoA-dependent acyltransferase, partial [Saccharata proteae CBS 121410]
MIDLPLDDISRFKAAWDAVVTSHPILRTRVVHLGAAGMFQVVLKPSRPAIEWHESTNLDEYVAQDRNVPMGFGDPLVRYGLIKTTEGLSFIWTAHHAIYDGATVSMLSEAVSKAYMGNALDEPPPFKRLLSYLTKLDPAHSDQFWRETLAGARPMPFPVPRLDDPSTTVDSVITRDVSIQAKPSGITIATLLQVAWSFVLARYSGSDDVVLGLAQSGRMISVPEIDRIPGPAVTTVPMRVRFDSEQTIPNLLETVQKTNTDSIPHCHRGLQNIKRVSEDARQACGFRSLLTIYPKKEEQELVFDMSNGRVVEGGAADFHTYPLLLECQFTDSTARVTATHDSKVIDVDQMLWMIQQLDHVIQQLTTPINGCISIGEIELFTPEQRQKIKA